jgi:fatty acid-binding protein DegV
MALRNGLVIDASADLPDEALRHALLRVLPVRLQLDTHELLDDGALPSGTRLDAAALKHRSAHGARSMSLQPPQIRDFFLSKVALDFDHAFALFASRASSAIFDNAFGAARQLAPASIALRNQAGLRGPLFAECHDSRNLMSGYGVQVLDLLQLLELTGSQAVIRQRLALLAARSHVYAVPRDLEFIRLRGRVKGDNSVSLLGQAAARYLGVLPVLHGTAGRTVTVAKVRGLDAARDAVLRLARRRLLDGLDSPHVVVSYSGDLAEIAALDSYRALQRDAQAREVRLALCPMSAANALNIGAGALTVGFVCAAHDPSL